MIRGRTVPILLPPMLRTDLKAEETVTPDVRELRNGTITRAGNWIRRPGFARKWRTGAANAIVALIPKRDDRDGYAITGGGEIFWLVPTTTTSTRNVRLVNRRLSGVERPTWAWDRDSVLVANGSTPVALNQDTATLLTGESLPPTQFIATLDGYVLVSGEDATRFRWSAVGNRNSWPEANFNNVLNEGERIRMMIVLGRELYFFCDHHTEVWVNVGGEIVWARQSTLGRGTLAGHSIVQANNTLYWLGDDQHLYVLNGTPQFISPDIRATLDQIHDVKSVYGCHFNREHLIRWFAPTEGICVTYDYLNDRFWLDNRWHNGQARLNVASYAEIDGTALVGDFDPTGLIYTWSTDHPTDDGDPIRTIRRFSVPLSSDATVSRVNRLRIRTTDAAILRWAFDDHRPAPAQPIPATRYADIWQLGLGRELHLELVSTAATLVTDLLMTVEELHA